LAGGGLEKLRAERALHRKLLLVIASACLLAGDGRQLDHGLVLLDLYDRAAPAFAQYFALACPRPRLPARCMRLLLQLTLLLLLLLHTSLPRIYCLHKSKRRKD
jgi:hypothetical protein